MKVRAVGNRAKKEKHYELWLLRRSDVLAWMIETVLAPLPGHADVASLLGQTLEHPPTRCLLCAAPLTDGGLVFVAAIPAARDERSLCGLLCARCSEAEQEVIAEDLAALIRSAGIDARVVEDDSA